MKKALITGITGQDGSYLAEFLLEKGYEVFGMYRRTSGNPFDRIQHLQEKIKLVCADLLDQNSLNNLIEEIQPDEVYNLAAQSFVPTSWQQPMLTGEVTALGTTRLLEAIRHVNPKIKFYQASSSEMFGKVQETPQTETTPLYPRSPYGVSKVYAHWITKNYRESYGMFAVSGILFNHECVSENTPVIIKKGGFIDIARLKDIRKPGEKGRNVQQWVIQNTEIWDGKKFVPLHFITATKRKRSQEHKCKLINTRQGVIEVTNHHNMLSSEGKKIKASDAKEGSKLLHGKYPGSPEVCSITEEEAKFLGMMAGDGYISSDGRSHFVNNDNTLLNEVEHLWKKIALGSVRKDTRESGFGGTSTRLHLSGNSNYLKSLRNQLYASDGLKKVPQRILNAPKQKQNMFLKAYNNCDVLKANPCTYEFKNFKTNSPVLAQGLLYLLHQVANQDFNITFELDEKYYGYNSINVLSPVDNASKEQEVRSMLEQGVSQREISRKTKISRTFIRKIQKGESAEKSHHLSKPKEEVKKTIYHAQQPEWVFDLETETGRFMGGVGNMVVANSPRRGLQFVTRKVTHSVAKIKLGMQKKLLLGNLDAKRDWGFARDYAEAMYLMMQHENPEDFVIATGETHSIKELCEVAFDRVGLNWEDYVKTDDKFKRPAEVDLLVGDSSKAKKLLNWEPKVKFKELIQMMVDADLKALETK